MSDQTTLRVWVLEPCGYDEYGIAGIFATAEAAKTHYSYLEWNDAPEEDGSWYTRGNDLALDGGYHVYAEEVRS